MDFVNWKTGLSIIFYVLIGIEKLFGDVTPDMAALGTPPEALNIIEATINNGIDTLSLIAVSVLGLSGLKRPDPSTGVTVDGGR